MKTHYKTIKEAYDMGRIKIGTIVKTNGSGDSLIFKIGGEKEIKGEIGYIYGDRILIYQNESSGCNSGLNSDWNKKKGYKYSWMIDPNNTKAWIDIYEENKMFIFKPNKKILIQK